MKCTLSVSIVVIGLLVILATTAATSNNIIFPMVRSSAAVTAGCLPNAAGRVTIPTLALTSTCAELLLGVLLLIGLQTRAVALLSGLLLLAFALAMTFALGIKALSSWPLAPVSP